MKKISFFRKLKLFFYYKKVLNDNKTRLENELNIRIDDAKRMYTVLNIPEELYGEFTLKKSDIDKISESYIREYNIAVSTFLKSIGLAELFESYEVRKVDKYSYLLIIGFSLFKTNKFYDRLYYRVFPILAILLVFLSIYFIV